MWQRYGGEIWARDLDSGDAVANYFIQYRSRDTLTWNVVACHFKKREAPPCGSADTPGGSTGNDTIDH